MPALPIPAAQTQAGLPVTMPAGRREPFALFPESESFADSMVAAMAAPGGMATVATIPDVDPSTSSGMDTLNQIAMVAPIVETGPMTVETTAAGVTLGARDGIAGKTRAPATQSGKDTGTDATVIDAAPQLVASQPVTPQSMATPSPPDLSPMLPAQLPKSEPPKPEPLALQSLMPQSVERVPSLNAAKMAMQTPTASVVTLSPAFPSPPVQLATPPPPTPQQPQQAEQSRQVAGAARVDVAPSEDRARGSVAFASPAAPDAPDPSPAKATLVSSATIPVPEVTDLGSDVLAHAAAGQVAAASAMPSTVQARTVVPADARVPPSAATAQMMPAIVSLAAGAGGSHSMTLRLDPASLGAVQIRIDRSADAPARVDITADRPETLVLLQNDQHHLQQALDQAGIPAEGRQLSFHNAAPSPDSAAQPSRSDIGSGDFGQRQGHGQAGQNGPHTRRGQGGTGDAAALDGAAMQVASGWLRAGIDITA